MSFLNMKTEKNDSAVIEVYDGTSPSDKLLALIRVRNGTLPQSVTTTRSNMYIKFSAEPHAQNLIFARLTSGYSKFFSNFKFFFFIWYCLNCVLKKYFSLIFRQIR